MTASSTNRLSVGAAQAFHETGPGPTAVSPWRKFWSHPLLIQYHRWFALVLGLNFWCVWHGATQAHWWHSANQVALSNMAHLCLANFALAILIRQQYLINALFWLATRAPTHWPLALRWQLGKVYHFGGLHSSAATCGSAWLLLLWGSQLWHVIAGDGTQVSRLSLALGGLLLLLLVGILLTALPGFRAKRHDCFEQVHRWGGWSALALFWAHTFSTLVDAQATRQAVEPSSLTSTLWMQPEVWVLALLSASIALPWLRLKRVPVHISKPSSHAVVVQYDYGDDAFPGSSNAVSLHPLGQWHSFANIPAPGRPGFRHIISRAGDWTGALIDKPPSHVWVKGISTAGVANIEVLFKSVVYIATGSGIGPVLPHLLAQQLPMHLIWATRNPLKTYGEDLVAEILHASPKALIWDTDAHGKPDLVALALDAVHRHGAEAVICIANQKLTRQVIQGVERHGIPGYGAIWDS